MMILHKRVNEKLVNYWETFRGFFIENKCLFPSEGNNNWMRIYNLESDQLKMATKADQP